MALTETLTPELMQPVVVKRKTREKPRQEEQGPVLLGLATFDDIASRVYVAVGVNHKGHRGLFSQRGAVPLIPVPPAPTGLRVTYTETQIDLAWTPPAGAPPPPAPRQKDPTILPRRPIAPGGASWFYDVFEVPPPAERSSTAAPASLSSAPPVVPRVEPPVAVNKQPLPAAAFTDARLEFGTERCYEVRTVNVFGKLQEESEASDVVCVTPRDTFPPAPPRGLIAVPGEGVISLSWEPNSESDLAGYLVLRAEQPGGALQPLMREPIQATTFDDKTVKPGVRYVYAVAAVDKATPPNISRESERIEETAR